MDISKEGTFRMKCFTESGRASKTSPQYRKCKATAINARDQRKTVYIHNIESLPVGPHETVLKHHPPQLGDFER